MANHQSITYAGFEKAYDLVSEQLNRQYATTDFSPQRVGDRVWYDRKSTLGDISYDSALIQATYFAAVNPDLCDMEDSRPIMQYYIRPIMDMHILDGYNAPIVISWIMEQTWDDTELYYDFDFEDTNDFNTTMRMLQLMVCHDFIGWAKEHNIQDENDLRDAA